MKQVAARSHPSNLKPHPFSCLAIAAHPDDIEFGMAGTLLLLRDAGWRIHYLNLSTGNCGSMEFSAARTRAIRRREAQTAAKLLGAQWHPPFCDDLEIFYDRKTLRRVAALPRHLRVEDDLQQEVAEFLDHLVVVAGLDGVHQFINLFDGVMAQGDVILFPIPRAALGRTQGGHDGEQRVDRAQGFLRRFGHGDLRFSGFHVFTLSGCQVTEVVPLLRVSVT